MPSAHRIIPPALQGVYDNWHFAPAVVADGLIFCSGIIGTSPNGDTPGADGLAGARTTTQEASNDLTGLLMLAVTGGAKVPTATEALYLTGALAIGAFAYWTLTEATRVGEISVVTPFRYSRLLFSTIVGALVFSEFPDTYTLAGAGIIIATGLYTIMRERKRRRQEAARARAESAQG
mgnify:CR=1 FL=1